MSSIGAETPELLSFKDAQTAPVEKGSFLLILAMLGAWTLLLFVFSTPFRGTHPTLSNLDLVGSSKVLTRLSTLAMLLSLNLMMVRKMPIKTGVFYLFGFFMFAAWAVLTVLWSPLPDVSFGQWVSLFSMTLLGLTIARLVETDRDAQFVFLMLGMLFTTRSGIMFMAWALTGGSGISRLEDSFFHSTDAAETATLGLLMMLVCNFGFPTPITRALFLPSVAILLATFVVAQNRLTVFITPPVAVVVLLMYGNRNLLVKLAFLGSVGGLLLLIFDPAMESINAALGSTEDYAVRAGNSEREFSTLSGRTELWEAIWRDYITRPWIGLGFFITSRTGTVDVWHDPQNYRAHNQVFQVLATTGAIGLTLFLSGFFLPGKLLLSNLTQPTPAGRIARSVAAVFSWLILWGLLNSSFCGPINASGITFWCLLGLTVGRMRQEYLRRETEMKIAAAK